MQRGLPRTWHLWLPSFGWVEESVWNLSVRRSEEAHGQLLFPRLPGPDSLLSREILVLPRLPQWVHRKVGSLRSGTLTPSLGSRFLPAPHGSQPAAFSLYPPHTLIFETEYDFSQPSFTVLCDPSCLPTGTASCLSDQCSEHLRFPL